jgi:glycosyltransferase involved in cell wall biosynthesis
MKIGTLAFTTCQGLGILAKAFYDYGIITDVLTVRHGRRPEHPEWYPDRAGEITNLRDPAQVKVMEEFCARVDVMLFFETPFEWRLLDFCRKVGVKTALMPMYECAPAILPSIPDLFICPSLLDLRYFPNGGRLSNGVTVDEVVSVHIPVPVSVPWRQRTRAEVFVHNAGWGGLKGRNGTAELIKAFDLLKSPATILIRSQADLAAKLAPVGADYRTASVGIVGDGPSLHVLCETFPYETLYEDGDVFIFPEKFNGLSLPLQEARAAGMLVMGSDRFPISDWLPRGPLIPVSSYRRARVSPRCVEFDEAVIDPHAIAAKIDEFCGRDITAYSQAGRAWAEGMSWAVFKPRYLTVLEELCK